MLPEERLVYDPSCPNANKKETHWQHNIAVRSEWDFKPTALLCVRRLEMEKIMASADPAEAYRKYHELTSKWITWPMRNYGFLYLRKEDQVRNYSWYTTTPYLYGQPKQQNPFWSG